MSPNLLQHIGPPWCNCTPNKGAQGHTMKAAYFGPEGWILLSGGLSDEHQLLYDQKALLQCQQHCPQAAWWVLEQAHTWRSTPVPRKVMSGAVNNAPQLKILLNQNVIRWVIENMPTKERYKTAEECKWPFYFMAHGALTWIQAATVPKPLITPRPITPGLILLIYFRPAILSPALVLQSEFQASPPMSQERKGHLHSSAVLYLSFVGIFSMTHLITFWFKSILSLGALLTAPDMTFLGTGCGSSGVGLF